MRRDSQFGNREKLDREKLNREKIHRENFDREEKGVPFSLLTTPKKYVKITNNKA